MLNGKHVALGITGGIAAYKAAALVSLLKKRGCEVRCVMTAHAKEFLTPLTLETLSGNRVSDDLFGHAWEIEHISLAKWADVLVVAPATANILAKTAAGIADDLLSTVIMASPVPVLFAPAMNTVMWKSAANQANLSLLSERGYRFAGPESGRLACGDEDIGRMSEPEVIAEALENLFAEKKDFEGKKALVTAGPTCEAIDPVRFISNRSTGKMGYAIAEALQKRGADVTLVSGPVSIDAPKGVKVVPIRTTLELYDAVTRLAPDMDIVIQSAAPADYRCETVADQKIKKSGDALTLKLVPNPDIAKTIGANKKPGQIFVGFAAETENVSENAAGKLVRKNLDMIVANDVTKPGAGFAGDTNIVTMITAGGSTSLPLMSKKDVAHAILDAIGKL